MTAESDRIEELLAYLDTGATLRVEGGALVAAGMIGAGSTGRGGAPNSRDPSVAASALKRWLGALPEPLFPSGLYSEAMALTAEDSADVSAVHALCIRLPPPHHATLVSVILPTHPFSLDRCREMEFLLSACFSLLLRLMLLLSSSQRYCSVRCAAIFMSWL